MKIDTLEDLAPHLKRIEDAKIYLTALKEKVPSLLIFSDVESLSEIDSPANAVVAIKSDISASAALLESIAITLDEESHPLKEMIRDKNGRSTIKIGRFELQKDGNSYFFGFGTGLQRVSRAEIAKVAREVISKEACGVWYGDMKDDIFESIDKNFKAITYAMDRAYDRNNKYEYARLYEQREEISSLVSTTLAKLKKEIALVEVDEIAKDAVEDMRGRGNARANDIKKDSLVLLKDERGKAYTAQNPKSVIVDNELLELFEENLSMNAIELDSATDIAKVKALFYEIKGSNIATKEAYGFGSRLLGRHNALGIYFKEGKKLDGSVSDVNKVIVDLRYPASFIHELTHHIDLSGEIIDRDVLVTQLDSYNSYEGVDKVNYFSNDAELVARAGEVSYTLYQSKFGEILELIRAQNNGDVREVGRLREEVGVSYDVDENNFLDVLRQNSYTNGLSKELDYYMKNGNIYFDVANRSFEELAHIYSTFQDLLNYEHKVDYSVDNVFLGELSRESQREKRTFVRKEGLEKYTQDDFYSVAAGIRQGRIVNITLDELIDDYAALDRKKQGVKLAWVMGEIADRDLRLKHGFLAIDTYKEIYEKTIEIKGYCAHPLIGKDVFPSVAERDYFVALAKNSSERFSLLGNTFDGDSRLKIAKEMDKAQLATLLNESSAANTRMLTRDWFWRGMLAYHKERDVAFHNKAHEVFSMVEPHKLQAAANYALSYLKDGSKNSYDYGAKALGIDCLNKVGRSSVDNGATLNGWYEKAGGFSDRACEVYFKQELLKLAKSSGIVIDERNREDALAVGTLSNLRKNIYSKKEFSGLLKESDPRRLREVFEKYNEDLSEKYDAEYLKEHAYDSYFINSRNIAMFRPGEIFDEAAKTLKSKADAAETSGNARVKKSDTGTSAKAGSKKDNENSGNPASSGSGNSEQKGDVFDIEKYLDVYNKSEYGQYYEDGFVWHTAIGYVYTHKRDETMNYDFEPHIFWHDVYSDIESKKFEADKLLFKISKQKMTEEGGEETVFSKSIIFVEHENLIAALAPEFIRKQLMETFKQNRADVAKVAGDKSKEAAGGVNIKDDFYKLLRSAEVKDFTRTDTGEVIKVFTLEQKLSKDEFKEFLAELKKEGIGYYSKIAKGFIISDNKMDYFGKQNGSNEQEAAGGEVVGEDGLAPKGESDDVETAKRDVASDGISFGDVLKRFKEIEKEMADINSENWLALKSDFSDFSGDLFAATDSDAQRNFMERMDSLVGGVVLDADVEAMSDEERGQVFKGLTGETNYYQKESLLNS